MRSTLAALALVALAAGCDSSSSGGSAPGPSTPTPSVTHLGTLSISRVLEVAPRASGAGCPSAADAFPKNVIADGQVAVCDDQQVYLIDVPAVDESDIDATTVSKPVNGGGWTLLLQLSSTGATAFFRMTQEAYEGGKPRQIAFVYNGAAISAPAVATDGINGGLAQIGGLSKAKAKHMAKALNPS